MPYARKKYRKKKREYKRSRRVTKRKSYVPRGLFAKSTKMGFKYVDTITINPTSGSNFVHHTYSCNGMYDPDITGIGHQPRGFDQYMQFYNHYTVIGAKMKCTFVENIGTGADGNAYVGIIQTSGATPPITSINTVLEINDAKFKVNTVRGTRPRIVTSSVNLSKALTQKVLQEDNNAGTASANPVEQWYFQIMAASNDVGLVDPTAIQVLVEIDYIAVLHEPRDIAGS